MHLVVRLSVEADTYKIHLQIPFFHNLYFLAWSDSLITSLHILSMSVAWNSLDALALSLTDLYWMNWTLWSIDDEVHSSARPIRVLTPSVIKKAELNTRWTTNNELIQTTAKHWCNINTNKDSVKCLIHVWEVTGRILSGPWIFQKSF